MTILHLHREVLKEEWLDLYGHLNQAYYLVPFSNAGWALQDHVGLGRDYFKRTGCALYTKETRIRYLKEVRAPATLEFETIVCGVGVKRFHFVHVLKVDGVERTTFECLVSHIDTDLERSAPIPEASQNVLEQLRTKLPPSWIDQGLMDQVR